MARLVAIAISASVSAAELQAQPDASTRDRDVAAMDSTQLASLEQPNFITSGNAVGAVASEPQVPQSPARQVLPESATATTVTALEVSVAKPAPPAWRKNVAGLWRQVAATTSDAGPQPGTADSTANPGTATGTSSTQDALSGTTGIVPVPPSGPTGVLETVQGSVVGLWNLATQPGTPATLPTQPYEAAVVLSTTASPHVTAAPSAMAPSTPSDGTAESRLGSNMFDLLYQTTGDARSDTWHGSSGRNVAARTRASDLHSIVRRSSLVQQLTFADSGDLVDPTKSATPTDGAKLVAYLQEQGAEPEEREVNPSDELMPEPAAPSAQRENRAAEEDSLAGAERVGEAPEDRSLDFLRTETVLLEPGESQCDVGISYLLTENEFPILLTDGMGQIVAVDEVDFRIRELTVPLEYRMGLVPRVQGFIGAPIGWSNTQVALDAFDAFQNDGGFGDIDFGLTAQCVEASANCPYVIGTLAATAPTGGDPFTGALSLAPTAPSLGQGFWSIAGSLLFIQPYDPVVVFYGVGTEHFFSRHYVGLEIEPGSQYNYQFGVGFAVNERVTLSTRFFGAYVEEIKVNGDRRFGTNIEPMTIRLSATISQPCDRLVEPFVEFGITDDAVSSFFGITWTFSPKSHRKPNKGTDDSRKPNAE